jgi:hypothetical protein
MKKQNAGFILIFSLLMLATITAIVTYVYVRGSVYVPMIRTMIDREKAKMVALGGVQVAMAQLVRPYKEEEIKKEGKPVAGEQGLKEEKFFLTNFLPTMNRWQEYELKEEMDGIDSQLRICLMSEEGKININQIYDYEKKQFRGKGQQTGDWEKILQDLFKQVERIQGGKDLLKALETFLKKREYTVHDVTELLHIKEFEIFRSQQRYAPPEPKKSENKDQKERVYLTDIFTVDSGKRTVNPFFFSDSLSALLSLPRAGYGDNKERVARIQEGLQKLKQPIVWKNDWSSLLKPIYQKELQSLPKDIESVFDTSTTPRIFSVISQARVASTMQQLFVILERTKKMSKGKASYVVNIKKLYWL